MLHVGHQLVSVGEVTFSLVQQRVFFQQLVGKFWLPGIIADPLLAALAWNFDQPGVGTA